MLNTGLFIKEIVKKLIAALKSKVNFKSKK